MEQRSTGLPGTIRSYRIGRCSPFGPPQGRLSNQSDVTGIGGLGSRSWNQPFCCYLGNADKALHGPAPVSMPGTTRAEIRTLKVGRYVALEDSAYKILSMSKSKPGKHGSAKARIELEDIFTGQKRSHVGTVTDNINIPIIEKGSAIITHIQGEEVHAMDNKTYETLILPVDSSLNLESGREVQWMEAMGRYRITRDH